VTVQTALAIEDANAMEMRRLVIGSVESEKDGGAPPCLCLSILTLPIC
jgi:hypothetical protein